MQRCRQYGVTLIELLTVIMIIMILAAILAPVLGAARDSARKKRAKTELVDLTRAWEAYWRTYSNWPSAGSGNDVAMDAAMVLALSGLPSVDNQYEMKFMDFPRNALTVGFKDPWGSLYEVDLKESDVRYTWDYATRVYFRNRNRSRYE